MIDYLRAEHRVLREQLGERRLRFTDSQRQRLARAAKELSRGALADVAGDPGHPAPLVPRVGDSEVRRQR